MRVVMLTVMVLSWMVILVSCAVIRVNTRRTKRSLEELRRIRAEPNWPIQPKRPWPRTDE